MSTAESATCEVCGAPARVHVLVGYNGGRPVRRHCCLACAPLTDVGPLEPEAPRGRTRLTTLGIGFGVLMVIAGLARDWVFPQTTGGFGRYQWTAVLVAAGLFVVGVVARADVVAIGSILLVVVAVLADLIGGSGSPGVGWKQGLAMNVGLLIVAVAYLVRRNSNRRRAALPAGSHAGREPSADERARANEERT